MEFKHEKFLEHLLLIGSEFFITCSLLYLMGSNVDKLPFVIFLSIWICCVVNVLATRFIKPIWKYISITNLFFIVFEASLSLMIVEGSLKESLILFLGIVLFVNLPIMLSQSVFYFIKRIELT